MSLKRVTLPFAWVLLVLVWAGTAGAQQTYLLGAASGGQIQIGGGLPLPIQLTDAAPPNATVMCGAGMLLTCRPQDWGASQTPALTMTIGPGASVFPPLLIPAAASMSVKGTTVMTMGQKLTVPAGVLSRAPVQKTLGVFAQNPALYAVATNLGAKWPAAPATFMTRMATPTAGAGSIMFFTANTMTVFKATAGTRMITYKNTGNPAPFGGYAGFKITPVFAGGIKTSVGVTVYGLAGAKAPPPCTFMGFGLGCTAAILAAHPTGTGAIGNKALGTATTMGTGVMGKNVYGIKAGMTPPGTIIGVPAPLITGAVPTNMALSVAFPWTTGHITAKAPGAAGAAEVFFLSGMDSRTTMGAGMIQLVSGSLSTRPSSGPNANRGWVQLDLVTYVPVPSISDWGLVALGGLLLSIGAFTGLRNRNGRRAQAAA